MHVYHHACAIRRGLQNVVGLNGRFLGARILYGYSGSTLLPFGSTTVLESPLLAPMCIYTMKIYIYVLCDTHICVYIYIERDIHVGVVYSRSIYVCFCRGVLGDTGVPGGEDKTTKHSFCFPLPRDCIYISTICLLSRLLCLNWEHVAYVSRP